MRPSPGRRPRRWSAAGPPWPAARPQSLRPAAWAREPAVAAGCRAPRRVRAPAAALPRRCWAAPAGRPPVPTWRSWVFRCGRSHGSVEASAAARVACPRRRRCRCAHPGAPPCLPCLSALIGGRRVQSRVVAGRRQWIIDRCLLRLPPERRLHVLSAVSTVSPVLHLVLRAAPRACTASRVAASPSSPSAALQHQPKTPSAAPSASTAPSSAAAASWCRRLPRPSSSFACTRRHCAGRRPRTQEDAKRRTAGGYILLKSQQRILFQ